MKKILMREIDVIGVVKEADLVLEHYRLPFVEGTVETPGTFDVGFRDAGIEGSVRTLNFGIMKRSSNQPVAAGVFSYDEETGRIDEDSIQFKLMEVFNGMMGMKVCQRRARDIRNMVNVLVTDFGFINAVEKANNEAREPAQAKAKPKAASARTATKEMQEDEDVYIPILQKKKVYGRHSSENTRAYSPKVEGYDRRGHWRSYKSGKRTWIPPHKCNFHS